jgi:lipoprotein-anchoring transpeptidase ErfK/SrfK
MSTDRFRTHRLLWVTAAAGPLLVSGCSDTDGGQLAGAGKPVAPVAMSVDISPIDGADDVPPDAEVTVRGSAGRLTDVQVIDVPPANQLHVASVAPADGATVGIGHPLIVTLNHGAEDRGAVQDALEVVTEPAVEGAWYWIDDRTLDYRPEEFWPAGTRVTLRSRLAGVDLGHGMWGSGDQTSTFEVGRHQLIKVDVKARRMTVVRDGKTVRTFPVSTGKRGWETRNGVKVLTERVRGKVWTNEAINAPEEYTLYSRYAIRMTNSGEFIHDATWNPTIGQDNTSHGCVGLRLSDMAWIWANTMPGDPVVVTGSPKPYTDLGNRIADWNIDWERWKSGNASG